MRLARLLEGFPIRWLRPGDAEISELTVDDREAGPGTLYVARRGYYGDGHRRIDRALARGASALVVTDPQSAPSPLSVPTACVDDDGAFPFLGELSARFYDHPTSELRVYGVTGTNGKTSVAYLLDHMLRALGERPALMGTIEYRFGDTTHPACNTTPEAIFVQRFARRTLDAGATALVLEVSSHALALERTRAVRFDSVGFTNLSHEHLDFHGTMDDYRRAKERLFSDYLHAARAAGKAPRAAACVDDPTGRQILDLVPAETPSLAVAVGPPAASCDLTIEPVEMLGTAGVRFQVTTAAGRHLGRTRLIGRYNLANLALAAAMVAGTDERRLARCIDGIADFRGVTGRLEPVDTGVASGPRIFVDYAHTPDALTHALRELRRLDAGPVGVVVGCGGDRDRPKRPQMAAQAQRGAAYVVLTSDNPRNEDPERIIDEMRAGLAPNGSATEWVVDRSEGIDRAVARIGSGILLIAGKGHERYQERAGMRCYLDDREEARRAVQAQRLGRRSREMPLIVGWSEERRATLATEAGNDEQVAVRWCEAVLTEARTRPGGLWTMWAIGGPELLAAAACKLEADAPDEPLCWVRLDGSAAELRSAVLHLTPAHRGLVLTRGPTGNDPPGELADTLAPDGIAGAEHHLQALRAASSGLGAILRQGAPSIDPADLLALDGAERRRLFERWQATARERSATRIEPRPIPVPNTLSFMP